MGHHLVEGYFMILAYLKPWAVQLHDGEGGYPESKHIIWPSDLRFDGLCDYNFDKLWIYRVRRGQRDQFKVTLLSVSMWFYWICDILKPFYPAVCVSCDEETQTDMHSTYHAPYYPAQRVAHQTSSGTRRSHWWWGGMLTCSWTCGQREGLYVTEELGQSVIDVSEVFPSLLWIVTRFCKGHLQAKQFWLC